MGNASCWRYVRVWQVSNVLWICCCMISLISFTYHPLTHNVCLCEILYLKLKAEYILQYGRYVKSCKLLKCLVLVVCRGVFCSVNHFHASLGTPFTHTHNFVCCFQGLVFQSAFLQERTGRGCIIHKLTRWMILLLALGGYYSTKWIFFGVESLRWIPSSPNRLGWKVGASMRDTDLMAYREAWKLECWARSRPSISSYHLAAWCERLVVVPYWLAWWW